MRNVTAAGAAARAWELRRVCPSQTFQHAPSVLPESTRSTVGAAIISLSLSASSERDDYTDMWDDEDNNPYGSFARHDSNTSDSPGLASPAARKASASCP
jgi:hypothetical protein